MSETPYSDINKPTGEDVLHSVIKTGFALVPGMGSALEELMGYVISPALEQRRARFFNELANRLKKLEEEGRLKWVNLKSNEQFVDAILSLAPLVQKTSEEEKLLAFRNVLLNTALEEAPEKAISEIYIRALDTLTAWHIRILSLIDDPKAWLRQNGKTYQPIMSSNVEGLLHTAFPELVDQKDLVHIVWNDLEDQNFHRVVSVQTNMSAEGALESMTTPHGKGFLQFIRESSM